LAEISHSTLDYKTYTLGSISHKKGYVCIPAYNEEAPIEIVHSLAKQATNHALIIFINASKDAPDSQKLANVKCYNELKLNLKSLNLNCQIILNNAIDPKKAGVGFARKIIMDIAAESSSYSPNSWISGLDADCLIEDNYLDAIDSYFDKNELISGASIRFSHRILDETQRTGIKYYESHLRYLKLGLQWSGFPYYYHTVGSSMVIRSSAYKKVGGMNTKKAGEDFYFLQKAMPFGFGELNETCVYPEARISLRVPFGTGRAMDAMVNKNEFIKPYPFEAFTEIKGVMGYILDLTQAPIGAEFIWPEHIGEQTKNYFRSKKLAQSWESIDSNSKTTISRNKKFLSHLAGNLFILFLNRYRDANEKPLKLSNEINKLYNALDFAQNGDQLEALKECEITLQSKSISFNSK